MADIEKAMDALKLIDTELFVLQGACCPDYRAKAISSLRDQTAFAIDALRDGEGAEEWEAAPDMNLDTSDWAVWRSTGQYTRRVIAGCMTEATARRIASDHNRLPALEKAARAVLHRWHASVDSQELDALAAAVKPEGQ